MECKFLKHGIAPGNNGVIKPCCIWMADQQWKQNQHIKQVDLSTWHQSTELKSIQQLMSQDIWPAPCGQCEQFESQGRTDSMRLNGNQAYANYTDDDITLEIRPGNTCNFACQTCWPEASSRVAQYYHQLGMIDIKQLDSQKFENFDLLLPIANRIKDVVVLGGEPFYDKYCKKFLIWAEQNLSANLMMFTNGSIIDWNFLNKYPGKITLIFSLDAIGRPAEYIRFGTEWDTLLANYQKVRQLQNVEVRVNVTTSVYNYIYLEELIDFLCQDWPTVVSFGCPRQDFYNETSIPMEFRDEIIGSLEKSVKRIFSTNIATDQKSNVLKTLKALIHNLKTLPWNSDNYTQIKNQIQNMDRVKGINIADYCESTARMLSH